MTASDMTMWGELHLPRYDYECDTCHHIFELKQSFDSEPVATCPNCENSARRKFHAVPIVFKGSGWYVNDYGKRSNNANASAESKESSDSDSSSKSESKSGTESKESSDTSSKSESTTSSTAKTESTPAKSKSE